MRIRILRPAILATAIALFCLPPAAMAQRKAAPPSTFQLYVFDCGRLDIPDITPALTL